MTAYRLIFTLAAAYNAAFGVWAVLWPHAFFAVFDLEPPRYAWIWACLGMVIGVYSLAYAYVAFRPQRGDVFVVIGLLGKVLGPIGWLWCVGEGTVAPRTFPLILTNDLLWWFPFLFYLLRHARQRRAVIAAVTVVTHVAACAALLVTRGGTEAIPNMAGRAEWVANATAAWVTCWFLWIIASMSFLALVIVWAQGIARLQTRLALTAGVGLCAAGLPFDLIGESINIVTLTAGGLTVDQFAQSARLSSQLGAGIANGSYCAGGLLLSIVSWQVGFQRGWTGVLGIAMWVVGLGLTAAAFAQHHRAMVMLGAVVMGMFIPWAALTARRLAVDGPTSNAGGPFS